VTGSSVVLPGADATFFAVAFAGADFLTGAGGGLSAKASFSLRTTGASMVEDADRTNSPRSPSFARTTLLSTPNSLASSYTRTFATVLLLGPGVGSDRLGGAHTHRFVLIECPRVSYLLVPVSRRRDVPAGGHLLLYPFSQHRRVERALQAQSPRERPTALGEVETPQIEMQVSTATWEPAVPVGSQHRNHRRPGAVLDRYDPQQVGLARADPTTDARTHG
jgi:hypothetical protein